MATVNDLRARFLAGTRREIRKREALERQAKRDGRTPLQQLDALDFRLGRGIGAAKERNGLIAQLGGKAYSDYMTVRR